jgi:hypothetical protein
MTLQEEGYLDGLCVSALSCVLSKDLLAEEYLQQKVQEGSQAPAKVLWESRQEKKQQQKASQV